MNLLILLVPTPMLRWWSTRKVRRRCFHHDYTTGRTWISSALVDAGRAKHFSCLRCGWYWT